MAQEITTNIYLLKDKVIAETYLTKMKSQLKPLEEIIGEYPKETALVSLELFINEKLKNGEKIDPNLLSQNYIANLNKEFGWEAFYDNHRKPNQWFAKEPKHLKKYRPFSKRYVHRNSKKTRAKTRIVLTINPPKGTTSQKIYNIFVKTFEKASSTYTIS